MPEISKLTRRKGGGGHSGGGHSGGGHSGDGHSSGGKKGSAGHGSPPIGSKSGKSKPKVSQVDGLPKGHNKATTYGRGGGAPVDVKSGPFTGWRFGGETRSRVYGSGAPASHTLPWGFIPIVVLLEIDALETNTYDYYHSLPQNFTRPGGDVVQIAITSGANDTLPFFFVSDTYSAGEVKGAITASCTDVTVSDPIPFNSTGNIQTRSVVQFYRGGSAAALLQGYDNTVGSSGSPNVVPNPPFPPGANISMWTCLNGTIGASIPLMNGASHFPVWGIILCVILPLLSIFFCLAVCCMCAARGDDHTRRGGVEMAETRTMDTPTDQMKSLLLP